MHVMLLDRSTHQIQTQTSDIKLEYRMRCRATYIHMFGMWHVFITFLQSVLPLLLPAAASARCCLCLVSENWRQYMFSLLRNSPSHYWGRFAYVWIVHAASCCRRYHNVSRTRNSEAKMEKQTRNTRKWNIYCCSIVNVQLFTLRTADLIKLNDLTSRPLIVYFI